MQSFREMLTEMVERLEAEAGHIEMTFPYFVTKRAPVSGVPSLLDYEATFVGEIRGRSDLHECDRPWSREPACAHAPSRSPDYGAHNQRSRVTVNVGINDFIWIEELIELVEKELSCEVYGLLKRPDEKYVTELFARSRRSPLRSPGKARGAWLAHCQ